MNTQSRSKPQQRGTILIGECPEVPEQGLLLAIDGFGIGAAGRRGGVAVRYQYGTQAPRQMVGPRLIELGQPIVSAPGPVVDGLDVLVPTFTCDVAHAHAQGPVCLSPGVEQVALGRPSRLVRRRWRCFASRRRHPIADDMQMWAGRGASGCAGLRLQSEHGETLRGPGPD